MKLRADLKLVKQLDYLTDDERDLSYCSGCVFNATRDIDSSLCERVNNDKLTCGDDMIWVFEDDRSTFKFKENNNEQIN